MTKVEPRDRIREWFESAIDVYSETGLRTVEHLNQLWTPGGSPQAFVRYGKSGDFLTYGMALLAFDHEMAPVAFRACERWANLCLEAADPEEPSPQFKAYYYLTASAWLQTGEVPQQLVNAGRRFAERCVAIPEYHEMKWLASYSWSHALAGDWEQALQTISKATGTRPIVINTRGSMSSAQALAWAYQRMAGLDSVEKSPVQFIAALRKFLQGDGLLLYTIPWLHAYQAVFAPETRPADLLHLLRPSAT